MPVYFEHIITSPFLCIGQMVIQFQYSGMVSVVQSLVISQYIHSTKSALAFFISCACIRSVPGALLSLSFCITVSTLSNFGAGSSVAKYT